TRTARERNRYAASVLDWSGGAGWGSGVTDHYPAMQAALNSGETRILLPRKPPNATHYTISQKLIVPAGVAFIGDEGMPKIKLAISSTDTAVLELQSGAQAANMVLDGSLDERETAGFNSYVYGLQIVNAAHCRVTRIKVINAGATAANVAQ